MGLSPLKRRSLNASWNTTDECSAEFGIVPSVGGPRS
jgi:hypothetical protein